VTLHTAYHPAALDELATAASEFDDIQPGLGSKLLLQWRRKLQIVEAFPSSAQVFHGSLRRVLVRPFQLHLIYGFNDAILYVVAALDARMDPDAVRAILDARL
jgi:hypothetical protein